MSNDAHFVAFLHIFSTFICDTVICLLLISYVLLSGDDIYMILLEYMHSLFISGIYLAEIILIYMYTIMLVNHLFFIYNAVMYQETEYFPWI